MDQVSSIVDHLVFKEESLVNNGSIKYAAAMKTFELHSETGIDGLKLVEKPTPTQTPGPGRVLLKLSAASLNYRDVAIAHGRYAPGIPLPLVPLSDGCGTVIGVGAGVTRVKMGDRVVPLFFEGWPAGAPNLDAAMTARGTPLPGCAQEFLECSAEGVSRVPDHLTNEQAACLPCAALTAWRSLIVEGRIQAGQTVLLEGTGGVSISALQFAKMSGAEVIITSSSDAKLAHARKLGADHTINYNTHPEWSKEVRRITRGRGVDHVVEVGGAGTFKEALKSVTIGGHISIIGVLSGKDTQLPLGPILMYNLRLQGIMVGNREQFEQMCRAIALHKIVPVVDKTFPFEEFPKAMQYMVNGSHFGKVCLTMGGS